MTASVSTLSNNAPQHGEIHSKRPGWLVRLGIIGRIYGAEYRVIGVMPDTGVESGESGIIYGAASNGEIPDLESVLGGSLQKLMDDGVTLQATARIRPWPIRLIALSPLPQEQVVSTPIYPGEIEKLAALSMQNECSQRFADLQRSALGFRQAWNIGQMKDRQDFPEWLPRWICDLIRDGSREWLELPNPAVPRIEKPPVIPVNPWAAPYKGKHPTYQNAPR